VRSCRLLPARRSVRMVGPDQHPDHGARAGPGRSFLINPYGLLFDEVTASSLVKIDRVGNKVEPSEHEVNSGGFAIPSTVHTARPEIACVLHTHSIAGCAVSMQKDGLLPLNQHAL
jgi:ribulose-5-phosphate 4-epimerase/fuculose-1-phosphate aldolase